MFNLCKGSFSLHRSNINDWDIYHCRYSLEGQATIQEHSLLHVPSSRHSLVYTSIGSTRGFEGWNPIARQLLDRGRMTIIIKLRR
jgi:hypothetical protein